MHMAQRRSYKAGACFASWLLTCLLFAGAELTNATFAAQPGRAAHELLNPQGKVEILRKGANAWVLATTNAMILPGDAIRTGRDSRAAIHLLNDSVIRMDQLTTMRFPEAVSPRKRFLVNLLKGAAYFFHRERPVETDFETPLVSGAIRGTEFNLEVAENGRTVVTLIEGAVDLSNPQGDLALASGEQAIIEPGTGPVKTAVIDAINVIQWCLYYPAIIDVNELPLTLAERQTVAESLAAYRTGDLIKAVALYPANRQPVSSAERIYVSQLKLAVGQVDEAQQILGLIPRDNSRPREFADALGTLIAAVKLESQRSAAISKNAASLLANSYYAQSQGDLERAVRLADESAQAAPMFGFAWARLAELEFSFGHTSRALDAINESLRLTPRNAQALAIKGFLLAAQSHFSDAIAYFDQAIAIDSSLGNAWLGRGLSRIRKAHLREGRDDLLAAAAMEPNRALLRSYLGKAFSQLGDDKRGMKELELAKKLDPRDPTAWLYSALLNQQRNRINRAIDDLEHSIELNNNRQVYRSRMLLDEDRAVRGANLASIYLDAGMTDTSYREAVRSANADYANYASHIFLANSYNQLRDPRQINLRYETPWLSEFLLANLLSPVGAGVLSAAVSQQEYSRLFERNRFGLALRTEYRSSGDWEQSAAQYGLYNNFSYSAEVFYRSLNGQRPNNDLDQLSVSLQGKYQVTPSDNAYVQAVYYRATGGDLRQYYNQNDANVGLRTKETQEPLIIAGWHHEWNPNSHTLFLGARLHDSFNLNDPTNRVITHDLFASSNQFSQLRLPLEYRSDVEIYSAELQHIWEEGPYRLIAGGRFQFGDINAENKIGAFPPLGFPAAKTTASTDFQRIAIYGYGHWRPVDPLLLIAGVTYDRVHYPENFRNAPVSNSEARRDRVSPKVGVIWTPLRNTTLRGAYTRSLGGVTFDQSFQLEPSQIAGFNQTFRSLIPESVAGALTAQRFETFGLALDQKFPTRTYIGVSAELLRSDSSQQIGTYEFDLIAPPQVPGSRTERLKFEEKSLTVTINQLLSDEWSLGAQYRLTHAAFDHNFPGISANDVDFAFVPEGHEKATLHQLRLFTIFNHPSGFFSQAYAIWSGQSNKGYSPDRPGDDFWQFNAFIGYRFPRRFAEVSVGLLNITDRDYRLNPLTMYTELPRERTAVVALKLNF